jgi:hypothetical protein
MRRPPLHFVVRMRMTRQVLPCVSALACGVETRFFILTRETVR